MRRGDEFQKQVMNKHESVSAACWRSAPCLFASMAKKQLAEFDSAILERFKKYCSHPGEWRMKQGLLTFGFVSAQSQGFQTCSFAKASPKVKIPGSGWLQYFLNRSRASARGKSGADCLSIAGR
jgi:hypothetical protein